VVGFFLFNCQSRSLTFSGTLDKEIDIIHELSQEVLRYEDMLNSASDICGELDRCGSAPCGLLSYGLTG
jgi:hypothetical protein